MALSIAVRVLVAAAIVGPGLAGCGEKADVRPVHELAGDAMGTTFSVKVVAPPAAVDLDALRLAIEERLAAIDGSMSTYRPDSELSRFNASRGTGWFEVSAGLCAVIDSALAIAARTDGAFDVTVGPLVNLWGFGPDGSVARPPADESIASAMNRTGFDHLAADCARPGIRKDLPEIYVDLSAIAKGHAVDQLAALLDAVDIADYLVEIGGELRARGRNARGENWAIAIEAPRRGGRTVDSIVGLEDSAMATSGDYRNYFEHSGSYYSHTIDPRSGRPVTHGAASVTVVADTAVVADGMATGLLVLGPEDGFDLAERERIAAYFLVRRGSGFEQRVSSIFADEVTRR